MSWMKLNLRNPRLAADKLKALILAIALSLLGHASAQNSPAEPLREFEVDSTQGTTVRDEFLREIPEVRRHRMKMLLERQSSVESARTDVQAESLPLTLHVRVQ